MLNDFIYYTTAATLLYQILRAGWHWGIIFVKFMFDEGLEDYNPKLEKPRLFFHLNTIAFSLIAFIQLRDPASNTSLYLHFFYLVAILFFGIMFLITWSNWFETRVLPKVREVIRNKAIRKKVQRNKITEQIACKIFDGLVSNGFMLYDDLKIQDLMKKKFIVIFGRNNCPFTPTFKLEMDNIQTHVLYQRLKAIDSSITLKKMTKIFTNENGIMTVKSLSNSYTQRKTENAKDEDLIHSLFDNL